MPPTRSADIGWAQRFHWLRYLQAPPGTRHEAHIADTMPLPAGLSTDQVRAALTHLARRHEVLRTVYSTDGRQHVRPPAPQPAVVATVEDDGTPSPQDVVARLVREDYDLTREWPMRICVVTRGGVPIRLHAVFHHVASDDVCLGRIRAELAALLDGLAAGRPVPLEALPEQPVDVARQEAALPPAATAAAREHWRATLAAMPADLFAGRRAAPAGPGAHSASLTSPTLPEAVRRIADRAGVWPSAVHLAAHAVTMAACAGVDLVGHGLYTSQRGASGFGDVTTCLSFPVPVLVDLSDAPAFDELVRRCATTVELTLRHAHVPYDALVELAAGEGRRRGERVRLTSDLNLLDNGPRSCGARREVLTRNPPPAEWALTGADSYLRVYRWSDGLTLALQAADAVLGRDDVDRWLRGYAAVLHRAAADGTRTVARLAAELDLRPEPRVAAVPARTGPGTGLSADPRSPTGTTRQRDAERALVAAVGDVNGLPTVRADESYCATGGRVLAIPQVLAALAERGWTGPAEARLVDRLTGIEPLSAVAAEVAS